MSILDYKKLFKPLFVKQQDYQKNVTMFYFNGTPKAAGL